MTAGLDVVSVEVEHESAVVRRVVDLADAGAAVVGGAGGERCLVEGGKGEALAAELGGIGVTGSRDSVIQKNGLPSLPPNPPVPGMGSISIERPRGSSAFSKNSLLRA